MASPDNQTELSRVLFEEICKAIGESNVLREKRKPSFFFIYAHDNERFGETKERQVKILIKALDLAGAKIHTDQTPVLKHELVRPESSGALYDILENQFCLLPKATSPNPVDKVILFHSPVLETYLRDPGAKEYVDGLKACYHSAVKASQNPPKIRKEIASYVLQHVNSKGFHHVLTEYAFLDLRTKEDRNERSIIPVRLLESLPENVTLFPATQIWLRLGTSDPDIAEHQSTQQFFFKLLTKIYGYWVDTIRQHVTLHEEYIHRIERDPRLDINELRNVLRSAILDIRSAEGPNQSSVTDTAHKIPTSRRHEILDSLAFPEMYSRRSQVERAAPETLDWIFRDKTYLQWLDDDAGILGIRGKPGSGKSTLLKRVWETLKEEDDHLCISFFFHRRGNLLQYTKAGMYRTLLHDLLKRSPEHGNQFWDDADNNLRWAENAPRAVEWSAQDLKKPFRRALIKSTRPIRIFIDALDEAGILEAQDIIADIRDLSNELSTKGARISICYSCRHFPVLNKDKMTVCVDDRNAEDIRKYTKTQLSSRIDSDEITSEKMDRIREELTKEITRKAQNIFLWAILVIPFVERRWNQKATLREARAAINKCPTKATDDGANLSELYSHILKSTTDDASPEDRAQTLDILQYILFAQDQLTLAQLQDLLIAGNLYLKGDQATTRQRGEPHASETLTKTQLHSATGGLVELVFSHTDRRDRDVFRVHFIHQSVIDFLLEDQLRCIGHSFAENLIGKGHDRLRQSCTNILQRGLSKWDISRETQLPSMFEYATTACLRHAKKAEDAGISQIALIDDFGSGSYGPGQQLTNICAKYALSQRGAQFWPSAHLLHTACKFELYTVIEALSASANWEEVDEDGFTPLHHCAMSGNASLVDYVCKLGAIPDIMTRVGHSALSLAAREGHLEVVKLLHIKHKQSLDLKVYKKEGSPLILAARTGKLEVVEFLYSNGAEVNAQGGMYGNALQAAANAILSDSGLAICELLLNHGANVNAQGGLLGNALQAAAVRPHGSGLAICELLLKHGANVNAQGGLFGNALQAAVVCGSSYTATCELLLKHGADVNAQGGHYGNALQAATCAYGGCGLSACKLLLKHGADVNAHVGNPDYIVLDSAVRQGNLELVELLLKAGADCNETIDEYERLFEDAPDAVKQDKPAILALLVEHKSRATITRSEVSMDEIGNERRDEEEEISQGTDGDPKDDRCEYMEGILKATGNSATPVVLNLQLSKTPLSGEKRKRE